MPSDAKAAAGLHSTMRQSESSVQKVWEDSGPPSEIPAESEHPEYAIDRLPENRRTRKQTRYKVQWDGYIVENVKHEPVVELSTSVFRRVWAARQRHSVGRSEQTRKQTRPRKK